MNNSAENLSINQDCIFCKIVSGIIKSNIIYETEFSLVFQDNAPQAPIHYLIIPKQHVRDLVDCTDKQLLIDLISIPAILAARIGNEISFKLVTNNGYAAGQRVFHLHFHFMSGKQF